MRNLVIASHPDDEVLGCGGTIARLAAEGHEVYIAILGEGISSRYPQREQADPSLLQTLRACCHQVGKLLGAKELFLYNLPDNRFDTVPLLNIVKIIDDLVEKLAPEAIYTQHGGDLNIDHGLVFRATLTAARPIAGGPVKAVYAYEVPSSTEWAFQKFDPQFQPNLFLDISQTLEMKIQGMQLYESETRLFPHPRSPEALRANAVRWGSVAGLKAAEAFEIIRDVR